MVPGTAHMGVIGRSQSRAHLGLILFTSTHTLAPSLCPADYCLRIRFIQMTFHFSHWFAPLYVDAACGGHLVLYSYSENSNLCYTSLSYLHTTLCIQLYPYIYLFIIHNIYTYIIYNIYVVYKQHTSTIGRTQIFLCS